MVIGAGGTAIGTVFNDPGSGTVSSGGTTLSAVLSGGVLYVTSGGTAIETKVYPSRLSGKGTVGGVEVVSSAGVASGITINFGGTAEILSGATVSGSVPSGGGSS